MPKNIVILCDGTSNAITKNRSSILRLFGCLEKSNDQVVFYDPGVGTLGNENHWSYVTRRIGMIWGLGTGWGLHQNVKEAYRFLVEHYDKGDGTPEGRDRIYVFGFSRGAYTARVLCGFIHAVGLMDRKQLNLLDYAYADYRTLSHRARRFSSDDPDGQFRGVRLHQRILQSDRPPIRLLGLFDTGWGGIEGTKYVVPWGRWHGFTAANNSVQAVRHAVAIDEKRVMFRPQLWPKTDRHRPDPDSDAGAVDQDIAEVWFRGVHGDIGGGVPEKRSELAKIPLHWMIEEAAPTGLRLLPDVVDALVLGKTGGGRYVPPNACGPINRSMTLAWSILEFVPGIGLLSDRNATRGWYALFLSLFKRRTIPADAVMHASVHERATLGGELLPPNVPQQTTAPDTGA